MSGKFYTRVFYGSIADQAAFNADVELAVPAVLDAGALYLVRGEPVATYETAQQAWVTVLEWKTMAEQSGSPLAQAGLSFPLLLGADNVHNLNASLNNLKNRIPSDAFEKYRDLVIMRGLQ